MVPKIGEPEPSGKVPVPKIREPEPPGKGKVPEFETGTRNRSPLVSHMKLLNIQTLF